MPLKARSTGLPSLVIAPPIATCTGTGPDALAPVKAFDDGRSAAGLWNVAGNAMEWTADVSTDPIDGVGRIVRGGSLRSHPGACTVAYRYALPPETDDPSLLVGFRCVRDVR